jgi:hypothetical protein
MGNFFKNKQFLFGAGDFHKRKNKEGRLMRMNGFFVDFSIRK